MGRERHLAAGAGDVFRYAAADVASLKKAMNRVSLRHNLWLQPILSQICGTSTQISDAAEPRIRPAMQHCGSTGMASPCRTTRRQNGCLAHPRQEEARQHKTTERNRQNANDFHVLRVAHSHVLSR